MRFFNPTPGRTELLVTGLAGFLGALLLFAGDVLILVWPVAVHIAAPFGEFLVGAFYNLPLGQFFLISLATLRYGAGPSCAGVASTVMPASKHNPTP